MFELVHEVIPNVLQLFLAKKQVSLSWWYHYFIMVVNCDPSLPRDNVEDWLTVSLEVVRDHHDCVEELGLVLSYEDHIIDAREHILIMLEQSLHKHLSQQSENVAFFVKLSVIEDAINYLCAFPVLLFNSEDQDFAEFIVDLVEGAANFYHKVLILGANIRL